MQLSYSRRSGFTLIELMIVVAVIAVLAVIALPAYRDYVIRANLVDSTNELSAWRAQMEQYYQDARSYSSHGAYVSPCDNPPSAYPHWGFSCNATAATYVLKATGTATVVQDFEYTVDQTNAQKTNKSWGNSTSFDCWIMRRGGTCS